VLSTPEATEGRQAMARLAGALENAAVVVRPYDVEELRRLIEGE
jgi:hypothetical protein